MNPARVRRDAVRTLTDLPNVGPATAADLCRVTGVRHDPCVIDVFASITAFLAGDEPKPWWAYTAQRKR